LRKRDGVFLQAYRKLSLRFHPDKNEGSVDAQTAFADIVDAYEILGDPEVRKAAFWSYVYRKTISLPRQARDKHRKS
jgi:curved DNA-binding protein CbpA